MTLFVVVIFGAITDARTARSQEVGINAFFGEYEGRTLLPQGEQRNRDLRVIIRPFDVFGFTLEWRTVIYDPGKQPKNRVNVVTFEPAGRPNLFRVAKPTPSADEPGPKEPVDGEPYIWAGLADKTLTVYVLTITEFGEDVIQTYERTLTPEGMNLEFRRTRNGEVERRIRASLKRISD